jgi:energy-converting hydrogenase A subunit B
MLLAIVTIQGLDHSASSKLLGKIAQKMGRYTKLT